MMKMVTMMMKFCCCLSFSWSDEVWSFPEKRDWSSSWRSTVTHTHTHTTYLIMASAVPYTLHLYVALTAPSPLPAHTRYRKCSHGLIFYRTGISFHHNWFHSSVLTVSPLWHFSVKLSWQFDAPLSGGLQNTSVRHRQCVWSLHGAVGIELGSRSNLLDIPVFFTFKCKFEPQLRGVQHQQCDRHRTVNKYSFSMIPGILFLKEFL